MSKLNGETCNKIRRCNATKNATNEHDKSSKCSRSIPMHVISPYYWTIPNLYWNQDKEVNPILVPFYYEFV